MESALDEVVAAVQASAKYRAIAPELVRQLAAQELAKRRSSKEAIKATKNKLHQIAGAYLAETPDYARWRAMLPEIANPGADLRPFCRTLLANHASTRERLPLLETFYPQLFAGLGPISSLLDLACGFNPLTIPWMNLAAQTRYVACDIYPEQSDFFQQFFFQLPIQGEYLACNLLQSIPNRVVDVALLLKAIPCLEQVDKTIGPRLIAETQASVLIVSFPGRSLGGHTRGMSSHYEAHFAQLMEPFAYRYDKIEFSNEIVFRIFKNA